MKKGLIVGFDPGTTAALAILDIRGKLLILLSKRGMKKGEVIDRITSLGKPLLIAGDRYPLPKAIERLANSLGCKPFHPKKTLTIREKERLVKKFEGYIKNTHEKDALASALHAFKSFRKLFKKVEDTLASLNLENLYDQVIELLLLGKADNVTDAIEEVLKREERKPKIEVKVKEKKEDVERLRRRIKTLERDLEILREHCQELRRKLEETKQRLEIYKRRIPRKISPKTIVRLKREVERLRRDLEKEREDVRILKEMRKIELKGYYPLLELKDIRDEELKKLDKGYDLQDRVLLSDDLSNVHLLNDYRIKALISSKEPDEKILEKVEFPILQLKNIHLEKIGDFKVVKIEEIEEEIKKVRKKGLIEWLKGYRKRRI